VELSQHRFTTQEVLVSHANAALTPVARLRIGRLVVDNGVPVAQAAAMFQVSWPTAKRWADRYRDRLEAGDTPVTAAAMRDGSSRPQRCPRRTPQPIVRKIVHRRWRHRMGPVQIAGELGLSASTVYAVLVRCRLNRLGYLDRRTGEVIRRYEHDHPGSLVHVDVKKLGNIPDGGGWRFVGRTQGYRNKAATPGLPLSIHHNPKTGNAFVHSVIDDHSRVVYAEVHDDERTQTAVAVLRRATTWFAARGVRIERVLSDNGSCYRSRLWKQTCAELAITVKKTRPYRPQTNGKIERFHRTLADSWAFTRCYPSETARRKALPGWLHHYNHHRPHTAIGNVPPITRLTNLPGQYI
jgi:transposase InsO family protein